MASLRSLFGVTLRRAAACGLLAGVLALPPAARAEAQQDQDGAYVARALGLLAASVRLDGTLTPVPAADQQLFRVGDAPPSASPALLIEHGAHGTIAWNAPVGDFFGAGGAFDCARPTVACPLSELRLERFEAGAALFAWDLAGALERPAEGQVVRIAVLAHDPRYPLVNDARPNTPFAGVNKIWVMDLTAAAETMRFFQADGGQFREFRTDAVAGFSVDRGFTAIALPAFEGVTAWNLHTYSLAGSEEGGHALVVPGGALISLGGEPRISLQPAPPTPPTPCAPRAAVRIATTPLGDGVLEVTISAGEGGLTGLEVGEGPNWIVDPETPAQVPAGATQHTLRIRRTGPGGVFVPLKVTDACGEWPTFVGGGPAAF